MMTTTSPTTTEALTRDLLAVLREERAVHDELLQLAAQERAAVTAPGAHLGSDGPTALRAIVAQKEALTARLGELEQQRLARSGALSAMFGLPADSKLTTLTPHLHPTSAAALKAERAALLSRAQALVEANAANRDLITNVLGSTRATVNYLQALQRNASASSGQAAPRVVVRRVDRRA